MAVVSSDLLAGLLTNFQALFQEDFDAARNNAPWRAVATEVTSKAKTESYNWLGTAPQMLDVTHQDVQVEGLFSYNFSIDNLEYVAAIEVERNEIEDDRLHLVAPRIRQLAEEAARHPGQLLMQLPVVNGNAFDGVAWIADTRKVGRSANIDNNVASAGSGTTLAGFQADLATARATMRKFQDDQGRPTNNVGNAIMVPPELEQLAYQALNVTFPAVSPNVAAAIPAGANGVLNVAGYQIIVNPFLTDANDWYLLHIGGTVRPFIFQNRIAPSLEGPTTPTSSDGSLRRKFIYTVRARYAVGYGDPRHAIRIVN